MKKYNLSEIMTKANRLRVIYAMDRSESLTKAWGMAKLDVLKEKGFLLKMKNRWDSDDHSLSHDIDTKISELQQRIYPSITESKIEHTQDEIEGYRARINEIKSQPKLMSWDLSTIRALEGLIENAVVTWTTVDVHAYDAA